MSLASAHQFHAAWTAENLELPKPAAESAAGICRPRCSKTTCHQLVRNLTIRESTKLRTETSGDICSEGLSELQGSECRMWAGHLGSTD